MASLSFALLFVFGVVGSSWAHESARCSLEVEVTYEGAAPTVTCSDTCNAADGELWTEAVAYQRVATLAERYGLMVKVQYSRGSVSSCTTVPYTSEEATAAAEREIQACVDEAMPTTTAAPTTVAPTTAAPTTAAPTTAAPTTAAPTTAAPTTAAAPVATCSEGFFSLSGFCYLLSSSPLTRGQAITFCQDNGAVLAAIESQEEQDALAAVLTTHVFIGIHDLATEGRFTTMMGVPVTYTNWNGGEPNGGTTENCIVMRKNRDFRWNDVSCQKSFIALCKAEPTVAA